MNYSLQGAKSHYNYKLLAETSPALSNGTKSFTWEKIFTRRRRRGLVTVDVLLL